MASHWYNQGLASVGNHAVDWLADTVKVMLLGAGYSFNQDHSFISAVVASELSGTGYAGGFGGTGRKVLASKTVTQDNTADAAFFDAADLTWTAINAGTAAWAVLVKEVTDDAHSLLVAAIDINPDVITTGADLLVQWNAAGILKLAYT